MPLDDVLLGEAKEIRDRLLDLQHETERARSDYHHLIRRLHAAGGSLREIAEGLGLSHQRVHQIVESTPAESEARGVAVDPGAWMFLGRPPGPRPAHARAPFERFTERARDSIVLGESEAAEFGHPAVDTEHILLGLLRRRDGLAARALESLGVTLEETRAAVLRLTGEGSCTWPAGSRPLTPRAKKVLEIALRESLRLGHDHIGTEHVLLGLVRARGGIALRVLRELGADTRAVRRELTRLTAA